MHPANMMPSSLSFSPPLAAQFAALPAAWAKLLSPFMEGPFFHPLCQFVDSTYEQNAAHGLAIFPHAVFYALEHTLPEKVKVVILGQDPYHGLDHGTPQAQGLSFSVPRGCKRPPQDVR